MANGRSRTLSEGQVFSPVLSAFERAFHMLRVLNLWEGDGLYTGLKSRQPIVVPLYLLLKYHNFVSASEAFRRLLHENFYTDVAEENEFLFSLGVISFDAAVETVELSGCGLIKCWRKIVSFLC